MRNNALRGESVRSPTKPRRKRASSRRATILTPCSQRSSRCLVPRRAGCNGAIARPRRNAARWLCACIAPRKRCAASRRTLAFRRVLMFWPPWPARTPSRQLQPPGSSLARSGCEARTIRATRSVPLSVWKLWGVCRRNPPVGKRRRRQ